MSLAGDEIYRPIVWAVLIIILSLGSLLNYTMFLCTMLNSAVATTIVGGMFASLGMNMKRTL